MFYVIASENSFPLMRVNTQPFINDYSPLSSPLNPVSPITPAALNDDISLNEGQLPRTARGVIVRQSNLYELTVLNQSHDNVRQSSAQQIQRCQHFFIFSCAAGCGCIIYGLAILIKKQFS